MSDELANQREAWMRWHAEAQTNAHVPAGWATAESGPRFFTINPRRRMTDAEVQAFNSAGLLKDARVPARTAQKGGVA